MSQVQKQIVPWKVNALLLQGLTIDQIVHECRVEVDASEDPTQVFMVYGLS